MGAIPDLPVPDGGGDQRWKTEALAITDEIERKLDAQLNDSQRSRLPELVNLQEARRSVRTLRTELEAVSDEHSALLLLVGMRFVLKALDESLWETE